MVIDDTERCCAHAPELNGADEASNHLSRMRVNDNLSSANKILTLSDHVKFVLTAALPGTSDFTIPLSGDHSARETNILENGWSSRVLQFHQGQDRCAVKIVMPPCQPVLAVIGASHAKHLSEIVIANEESSTTKSLWERTIFVELNGGSLFFKSWFQDLFCALTTILQEKYKMVSTNHVLIAVIPFTRDFQLHSRDEYTNTLANNLLSSALLINDTIKRCKDISYKWTFLEPPLFPGQQIISMRCAVLCRELNLLNDPENIPVRIWNKTWHPDGKPATSIPCILPNRRGWHLDKEMFSSDRRHLSSCGYALWLRLIFTCSLLKVCPDRESDPFEDDFCGIQRCFNANHSNGSYFEARHRARLEYEKNTANHTAYNTHKRFSNMVINCDDLVRQIFFRSSDSSSRSNNRHPRTVERTKGRHSPY